MDGLVFKQLLLLLCTLPVVFNQEDDSCLLFFTIQPPLRIPCNPYQDTFNANARLNLQCTVHAPRLSLNPMERNYTIEWVREGNGPGAREEVFGVASLRDGLSVEIEHSSYFYSQSSSVVGSYVKSVLSIDLRSIPQASLPGKYWCQVLVKSLDNYSYRLSGRSNTETVIPNGEDYLSETALTLLPPCAANRDTLYQPYFKCVQDTDLSAPLEDRSTSVPVPQGGVVTISSGVLAVVAVAGGALIVIVLILFLVAVYSCKVMNERKTRGIQRNQVSTPSAEPQEVKTPTHIRATNQQPSHLVTAQLHPVDYQSSLNRRNDSYRANPKKNRMPHYSPDQQLIESFSTDTTTYSNKMKPTASISSIMS